MSRFLDERLTALKAYVPGEQPKPKTFIKLNTNEFPYPPASGVRKATSEAVLNMNLYSDLTCSRLKSEFKKVFGFGGNNVVFTNGSDESLYLCFLAFCGKNKGAAFADITYGFYKTYADLCCIDKKIIPLAEDFSITPSDYFGIDKTVFIANPNAPTGKLLSHDEIRSVLKNNPDNIVVIDEAYSAFSGQTCADLLSDYDNLVIVGTFSKSRGMAGARLGYIIASEEIISDIEKVKYSINPYNVNSLTQATGAKVLENNEYYLEKIAEMCDTRDKFISEIAELGFETIPSKANFVFTRHPDHNGRKIADKLRENGILVRHFDGERISDYVRISIGTPSQMRTVRNKLKIIVENK